MGRGQKKLSRAHPWAHMGKVVVFSEIGNSPETHVKEKRDTKTCNVLQGARVYGTWERHKVLQKT